MAKRELPKHVYRQRNGLYFQRRRWQTRKFQSDFGTPEFWKEYADILAGAEPSTFIVRHSFEELVKRYRQSPRYRNLKPRTALDYDKYLDFFVERMRQANPSQMKRKDVIRMRDANSDRVYFANYSLRVLRVLLEYAIDIGWREDNPARGVSELKAANTQREPWPREFLIAFRKRCPLGSRERLLMELCLGTGQRVGDVLEMRWSDLEDGGIVVVQNKTGKRLWVPILPELGQALAAASKHSFFILTNEKGDNRWSYRGASQAIRNVRNEIGALQYDIHSWRYNAACELVEAGCDDDLVSAVTGQSPAMVAHYTKQVRQRVRAMQAQTKRSNLVN